MSTSTLPTATTATTATTVTTVTQQLLDAIVDRDAVALDAVLAPDVWFRAMLVREVVEHHDRAGAVAMFLQWFHRAVEVEVVETSTHAALSREFLRYRVRLRPEWAPDVWHTIEQSGYARIADGRVRRLDLVCTGFVPDEPTA